MSQTDSLPDKPLDNPRAVLAMRVEGVVDGMLELRAGPWQTCAAAAEVSVTAGDTLAVAQPGCVLPSGELSTSARVLGATHDEVGTDLSARYDCQRMVSESVALRLIAWWSERDWFLSADRAAEVWQALAAGRPAADLRSDALRGWIEDTREEHVAPAVSTPYYAVCFVVPELSAARLQAIKNRGSTAYGLTIWDPKHHLVQVPIQRLAEPNGSAF